MRIIALMEYAIRHMCQYEWPLLEDFLYQAIYVPEGFEGEVPRSLVHDDPKCRAAFEAFGTLDDDRALVAEVAGKVVGACWVRTTNEYGHIDANTPSFSISLYAPYRGHGIGGALMRTMLAELHDSGYKRASLSVQKENPALHLYERVGFRIVGNGADETEWLMTCKLANPVSLEMRRAEPAEVSALVDLRINQLVEEGDPNARDLRPSLADYYASHLADGSFVMWLAMHGETIAGTGGVAFAQKPPYASCPSGRIALISGMYTLPECRRHGIARDLLCRALDDARARGCGAAHITASNAGVLLYQSLGFVHNPNFMQLTL